MAEDDGWFWGMRFEISIIYNRGEHLVYQPLAQCILFGGLGYLSKGNAAPQATSRWERTMIPNQDAIIRTFSMSHARQHSTNNSSQPYSFSSQFASFLFVSRIHFFLSPLITTGTNAPIATWPVDWKLATCFLAPNVNPSILIAWRCCLKNSIQLSAPPGILDEHWDGIIILLGSCEHAFF